ncbi:hypothetical protein ACJBU6_04918 [Exserohilum turcicum]
MVVLTRLITIKHIAKPRLLDLDAPQMVTAAPGYAAFSDLRRKMGTSSSQPISTAGRGADASTVASPGPAPSSHFSPNMDDVAASQQLIDEGARANPADDDDRKLSRPSAHDTPTPAQKKRRKRKAKATKKGTKAAPETNQDTSKQNNVPTSSPFPFPATQPEADEIVPPAPNRLSMLSSTSEHAPAVEVPDSQVPTIPTSTPAPPMSSFVVPSSVKKSKRTYKKSKKEKRDQATQDVLPGETVDELADTNMSAQQPTSPVHTSGQRKRSRIGDVGSSSGAAADVTPAPAKKRKIGTPRSATTVQDLLETDPIEDDSNSPPAKKTRLKRVKKPLTPIAKFKDVYKIPTDEADDMNEDGEAQLPPVDDAPVPSGEEREADAQENPSHKKRSASKYKTVNNGEVYDWAAPVRKPGKSPNRTSSNQLDDDEIMRDPVSSDDEVPADPPYEGDRSEKKTPKKTPKKRKRRKTAEETPDTVHASVGRLRRSNGNLINSLSSAERALNTCRDLGHPPDLRTTGDFTNDEEELIRRAIRDFQQRKGLDTSELVEIIQWNYQDPRLQGQPGLFRSKSDWSPQDLEDSRESEEFWDEIRSIGVRRSHDRMRRHIRHLYHQFKSGAWTEEEDEQLRNLHAVYPNQWKLISVSMGDRSMPDCVNRWRDYLQYGDNRKTSRWTEEEEQLLVRAVTTVAQRDEDHRAESGQPPRDEYTSKDINWPQVAREMGNSRSRIQASVKWARLQKRENPPVIQIEHRPRASGVQSKQSDEATDKKAGRGRKKNARNGKGSGGPQNTHKSQEWIENSDEEGPVEREKEVEDEPEPEASVTASKKSRKSKSSTDQLQSPDLEEALDDHELAHSPPPKKRGRARKSENSEADKPKKRRRSSREEDEMENGELEQDHGNDETSVPSSQKKKKKERGRKKKSEETDKRGEGGESERQVVEEGLEDQEDGAQQDEDEDGLEQDEQLQEEQGGDEREEQAQDDQVEDDESREESEDMVQEGGSEAAQDSEQESAEAEDRGSVEVEKQASAMPATPSLEQNGVSDKLVAPGVDQMLWGDKYDLIFKLQDRRDDYEEDIDWEDVRKDQGYPWSRQTLESALHGLIQLLRDNGREVDSDDFPGTVDDVMDFISEEHGDELEDHYGAA